MSRARLLVVLFLVTCTGALTAAARRPVAVAEPRLEQLPYQLEAWQGREATTLDPDTIRLVGADAFLTKPVDITELIKEVRRLAGTA